MRSNVGTEVKISRLCSRVVSNQERNIMTPKRFIILLAADDGMPKDCCSYSKDQFDQAVAAICLPITIPSNDFWFQGKKTCMNFARSKSAVHVLLSRFYPAFYLDFIQILFRFYPDFIQIKKKLTLSRFYPNFCKAG